mmetsp:Transcript_43602/g.81936  ORF Transcript_43602/g.81936 Transcript_43602/m.81936 type:complete len:346 (+) Transcript_43602:82-1119(+)
MSLKTSRTDSPAPKANVTVTITKTSNVTSNVTVTTSAASAAGKADKGASPLSSFLPSPTIQKDLAIVAALLISTALVYGKGHAVISMAKQCWKDEGAVVFCAKLMMYLLPFVIFFGAVVHLWLIVFRELPLIETKKSAVKPVSAFASSVWIICFGQTALSYALSPTTAMGFFILWVTNTFHAFFILGVTTIIIIKSVTAYKLYKKGDYKMAAPIAIMAALLVASAVYAGVYCPPGESYVKYLGKCAGYSMGAFSVPMLVVLLIIAVKMTWDLSMTLLALTLLAVTAMTCLKIYLAYKFYPQLAGGDWSDFLRLSGKGALAIFGSTGVVQGLVLLKRKFGKHSKTD